MGRSEDYGVPHDYQRQGNGERGHGQPAVPPQFQAQDQGWSAAQRQPYAQQYQPQFTQPRYAPPPRYQSPQYAPQQQYPPPRSRHTARNVIAGIGGLIVLTIGISVAANSGHSVQTVGNRAGTSDQGASEQKTAAIGTAITLSGNGDGEQMSVTVTKVISSAQSGDEFASAPAGDRLYAVQFRLRDTGSAAYSDAPSNGATVVDSKGQSYQAGIADTAAGCTSFPASENIAPGSSGLGCIVFEVPEKAKITQTQFTLDSGMGPQTGQWNVG